MFEYSFTCKIRYHKIPFYKQIYFIVFINNLLEICFDGQIWAFADDIALLYSNKNKITLHLIVNSDLMKLRNWCIIKIGMLCVNIDKTKFINFGYKS